MPTLLNYKEHKPHRFKRIIWAIVNVTLFRVIIGTNKICTCIRQSILRLFGASIEKYAQIYPSCKIYAPWNLKIGRVCIGPNTEIYNKAPIVIADESVISQGAFLCTASHDISSTLLPLITKPITIGKNVWIAADAFVGPGVNIADGAIVGARAVVTKDVEAWSVVIGNPAKKVKNRELKNRNYEHL